MLKTLSELEASYCMYIPGGGQCGCSIAEEEIMAVAIYLSTCIHQEVDNVAAALLRKK